MSFFLSQSATLHTWAVLKSSKLITDKEDPV